MPNIDTLFAEFDTAFEEGVSLEYHPPETNCGEFVNEFYGRDQKESIDYKSLVRFIHDTRRNKKLSFNYNNYKRSSKTYIGREDFEEYTIKNPILFSYKNENNIINKTAISGILNKRNCQLEGSYGYILNFNVEDRRLEAKVQFYYKDTKSFRKDISRTPAKNDFTIDKKYVAIELTSYNLIDYVYLIKEIQGNTSFNKIKTAITKEFVTLLKKTTSNSEINFLYKKAPDFVLRDLKNHFDIKTFFTHLTALTKYDTKGIFSGFKDSSNAIINLFKAVGNSKELFQEFRDNPKLLKEIYYNLDGSSIIKEKENDLSIRNRTLLSNFLLTLCYQNKLDGLDYRDTTFFIGKNYKFNSNLSNDKESETYFLQQLKGHTTTVTKTFATADHKQTQRYEVEETKFKKENEGAYYKPFDIVYLIDADSKDQTPYPVPAIFIKSISDEAEWKDINQSIRIGADILAIVLGVLTLGASSPLLLALAAADIALATTDILVAVSEDALMKTDDGRQFLENWNKVSLGLGIITAGPVAINAFRKTFTTGARLLAKATVASTQKFLRTAMLKLILEVNIANFTKNTIRIIPYEEVSRITKVSTTFKFTKLQKIGVIFVEGETQVANTTQKGIAAIYKGEVIVEGTVKEVGSTIRELANLKRSELLTKLDEIVENAKKGIRKATQIDIDALLKVRKYFKAGKKKNVAFTKGTIGGNKINLVSRSGGELGQEFDNFKSVLPENYRYKNGPLSDYIYHTEQKQVEYLYNLLKKNKNVSGKIEIVSDLKICDNCNDIINKFKKDFPLIKVTRVWVRTKLK